MVAASLYTAPVPVGASYAMLDQSREGREFWRVVQMSTHDVLCEYFEHDKVRMHFARIAGENLVSPDEKATGLGVFVFVGFMEAYGIGVPIGGSGRLTEALIACIKDFGGDVIAIFLNKDGTVKSSEPFITGFLDNNNYIGRPVDVEFMADGSMLLSDDWNGAIYRITYGKAARVAGR